MSTILRYLGPRSPWGPERSALATVVVLLFAAAILAPPLVFAFTRVFGWWWRLWL